MNSDRLYEQPTNEELAEYREIFDLVDRGEKIDFEPRQMNNKDVTKIAILATVLKQTHAIFHKEYRSLL